MTDALKWILPIVAILGILSSVVWFLVERRRVRYIPVLWGLWSGGLLAFRVAVYLFPIDHTPDQVFILNSISNTLYLLGALIVTLINTYHIVGHLWP